MLKQRVPTAIALILLVAGAIFGLPAAYFQLFVAVIVAIGAWEWAGLSGLLNKVSKLSYAISIVVLFLLAAHLTDSTLKLLLNITVLYWLLALFFICVYPRYVKAWGSNVGLLLSGICVLVPSCLSLMYLRSQTHASTLIVLLLSMVAAADIGAYFFGKAFGKRKLSPQVSPNKTWEGYAGGVFISCLVALIGAYYYAPTQAVLTEWFWLKVIVCACLLASFSVIGDLLESMIKRFQGVKDSGNILPGHGGILDRIDGITAAAPVFVLLLMSGII